MDFTTQNYGFMTCTSFSFVLAQLRELSRKIYHICSASSRILHGCSVRKFNCVSLKYMFQCRVLVQARKPNVTILPLWKKNLCRRAATLRRTRTPSPVRVLVQYPGRLQDHLLRMPTRMPGPCRHATIEVGSLAQSDEKRWGGHVKVLFTSGNHQRVPPQECVRTGL